MHRSLVVLLATVAFAVASPSPLQLSVSGPILQGQFKIGEAVTHTNGLFSARPESIDELVKKYLNFAKDEVILERLFDEFKQQYHKQYNSEAHESIAKEYFHKRVLMVLENNIKALHHQSSYILTLHDASDKSLEEILLQPAGQWPAPLPNDTTTSSYANSWIFDPYRAKRQVGKVVNQGSCGACVYFAAAACIESHWALKGHNVQTLSPQQLNDCAHDDKRGNHGCQHGGGTFVPTFDYIRAHGLTSWSNYPYLARDADCDHNKEKQAVAHINSWHPITPHGDEEALRKAVEQHGPSAVALHFNDQLSHYRSGIFTGECQGGRNHAVLMVGYGYDAGSNLNYWIVKNQWGESYGEKGYFRLARNHGNICDIAGDAVYVE